MKNSITLSIVLLMFTVVIGINSIAQPTEAAPQPPIRAAYKVISIYSDAYSDIAGTIFTPFWNQSTIVSFVNIVGNPTLKYFDLNWQGTELGSTVNALAMTHLHIDVWTSDETSLQITPISLSTPEYAFTLSPLTLDTWNSFDIPLTEFTSNGVSLSDIFQFKIVGAGGNTIYIDNLYFYNEAEGDDTEGPVDFTASAGLVTFNSAEILLNAVDASGGIFYEIAIADSIVSISSQTGIQKSYTFSNLEIASSYTFSITAKDFAGNEALNSPISLTITTSDSPAPAPIPPARLAYKVISIFSDAYTQIPGNTNFYPYWNQLTQVSMADFQGDPVVKYDEFNYQGIELGSDINALPMTHLHIDVWTPNETKLEIAPISRSKTNTNVVITPLLQNEWNSIDIALADVTSNWLSVSDIFQFFLQGSGGTTIYYDNFYFYNSSDIEDTEAPTSFTATKGVVTFSSVELILKATDNSGAVNFEITYPGKTLSTSAVSAKSTGYTITGLTGGTNYSFSVTAKDPKGNVAANSPIVITATTTVATTAPVPTEKAANVISIFSDSYTNIAGTNFNPYWNQTTQVSTIKVNNNSMLSYSNFNYQGTEFGSHVNASEMKYLHVDAWTANETALKVTVISPGKEKLVSLTPLTKNKWNSYDVLLTSFTGVNLADLFQFKFEGTQGKSVLLDNLYFYKDDPTSVSELTNEKLLIFPNPASDFIQLNSIKEIKNIALSNICGQALIKADVNSLKTTLNIKELPSGIYFVTVNYTNGESRVQKIIKQ